MEMYKLYTENHDDSCMTGHTAGCDVVDQPNSAVPKNAVKQSLCIVAGMAKANADSINNWF
jgi:hypothetical protein